MRQRFDQFLTLTLILVSLSGAHAYSLPDAFNSPSLSDEIVIIGGGPSGVDMAVRLKELGYSKITILEKNAEVGGKSKTVELDGIAYDMGSVFLLPRPNYLNVIELLQKYDMDSRKVIATTENYNARVSCAQTQFVDGCKKFSLGLPELLIGSAIMDKPELIEGVAEEDVPVHVLTQVVQNMLQYNEVHRSIFGDYSGRFLPRPENYSLIDKTAEEFLQENNLTLFNTINIVYQTGQGYGYLNEVPAYYMLHWVNPVLINALIAIITGQIEVTVDTSPTFLIDGYQPLWKKMVQDEQLNVEYNFDVTCIDRCAEKIYIQGYQHGTIKHIQADYIFVAAPQNKILPLLSDASQDEMSVFGAVDTSVFTTTLLTASGFAGDKSTSFSQNNANQESEEDQKLWWKMYKKGWITDPDNNLDVDVRTTVAYQYHYDRNGADLSDVALDTILHGGLSEVSGGSNITVDTVFEQVVWQDYFPRYSLQGLRNGGHWKILEIQGQHNTVYLGSLPSAMESVEDVVSYNKIIVEKIKQQL